MSRSGEHRATLADVATAVGVSRATVSKALNGRGDISDETRERVLAAVAQLGYRSTTGLSQTSGRRSIAVVFDIPASPYIVGVLQGVLAAATEAGVDLLTRLAPDRSSRTQRAVAREWVAQQQASGVVGIIGLTLSRPDGLLEAAGNANLPFVMVDPVDAHHRQMVSVGSSNWAGARTAAEHLLALGHRRIAWIGGPEESDAATRPAVRLPSGSRCFRGRDRRVTDPFRAVRHRYGSRVRSRDAHVRAPPDGDHGRR